MPEDFYALLGLPQSILADEEKLKDAWHTASANAQNDAEKINHAYAVLKNPATRIAHLLELHGRKSSLPQQPGAALFDLFFTVGAVLKKTDGSMPALSASSSALQRAGQIGTVLSLTEELDLISGKVNDTLSQKMVMLVEIDDAFPTPTNLQWNQLAGIANELIFLLKWKSEIQKRQAILQESLAGAML